MTKLFSHKHKHIKENYPKVYEAFNDNFERARDRNPALLRGLKRTNPRLYAIYKAKYDRLSTPK